MAPSSKKIAQITVPQLFNLELTVTRKFPVNSNGLNGEVDVQLPLFGLLLLIQPLYSSEQHKELEARADLEFSSDFARTVIN